VTFGGSATVDVEFRSTWRAADLGGQGWIVGPDGQVLGLTSRERAFVTVEIDLREAERAKQTYPRYVLE